MQTKEETKRRADGTGAMSVCLSVALLTRHSGCAWVLNAVALPERRSLMKWPYRPNHHDRLMLAPSLSPFFHLRHVVTASQFTEPLMVWVRVPTRPHNRDVCLLPFDTAGSALRSREHHEVFGCYFLLSREPNI